MIEPNDTKLKSFHFSYIFNFTTGAWTFSNPEALLEAGLLPPGGRPEALIWRDLILEDDLPLYDNVMSTAIQHGGNHQIQYRIKLLNDQVIEVDDYFGLTRQEGKWPTLVGTVIFAEQSLDLIRETERQILAGKLIGGMVHDFKNLLAGIQNILEWSKARVEKSNVKKSLEKTIAYTDQATHLIQNVLSVSSGKNAHRIEKVNLGEIVLELEDLIKCVIPSSIELQLTIADELPVMYGQSGLLKDMILNLCVNAKDAMKEEGDLLKIDVSSETRRDDLGHDQAFVRLALSDNGCGMTEQQVNSIFDAFYSTKDTGTGLGLWMVHEAICAFDGTIDVISQPEQGTTFEIIFPVIEKEVEVDSERSIVGLDQDIPHESFVFAREKTVLFVEDEPLIRSGVSSWLESWGINLLTADDGLKAIDLFDEHKADIDLVIQDFILPGKRGDALLEHFVAAKPGVPVIITSASPDKEEVKALEGKGAYAFLEKPFKMENLFSLLYAILQDK